MEEIARMNLVFRAKHDSPQPGKFGTYLGRGDGVVKGEMINGEVIWDLYENQSSAACDANLVGIIKTDDGAEIRFDVLGFFKRRHDTGYWDLSSAVRFMTSEPRYECFDECVGLISGHFDMESYTHEYRITVPRCAN